MPDAAALSMATRTPSAAVAGKAAAAATSSASLAAASSALTVAALPQSLVRSRISSSPTLLPAHLAQLVTALSLCARVSLRASALFIEAIVETLQCGTVTGLGVTRRALIAAVESARALHYVKEGLDWAGRSEDGKKSEHRDSFLQVLDKYTNLGIYLIHHTFTLAELFAMSGFYLTLNTLSTGFSAAEESVRMLDSIFGSNESSRALSSIITLVRGELAREDPHFHPVGLLADEKDGKKDEQRKAGTFSNVTALTKALTAFACLQTATHRRTLRELKLRVVYDCTVVVEGRSSFSTDASTTVTDSSSSSASSSRDPTPSHAGKYAGPPAPPRHPHSPSCPSRPSAPLPHSRRPASGTLHPLGGVSERGREESPRSPMTLTTATDLLTDVRGEIEARGRASRTFAPEPYAASSMTGHSRRASVTFGLAPCSMEADGLDEEIVDLLDERSEADLLEELESLCGSPTRARSLQPLGLRDGYDGDGEAAYVTAEEGEEEDSERETEEDPNDLRREEMDGWVPPEVQAALQQLEEQYSAAEQRFGRRPAPPTASSSNASTLRAAAESSTRPRRREMHLLPELGRYSYEMEVEETTTTTTTTVRTVEEVGEPSQVVRRQTSARMPGTLLLADSSACGSVTGASDDELPYLTPGADEDQGPGARGDGEGDWVEVASMFSPTPSLRRYADGSTSSDIEMYDDIVQQLPSAVNGADEVGEAASKWGHLAGTSRQEAVEHPEENRQRLQVVLSTMTKKFTQRRRTIRRIVSGSHSRSSSQSPAPGSSSPRKRRWHRSHSRTGSFSSGRPTPNDVLPPSPSASSSQSRAGRVFQALSRGWRKSEPLGTATPPNSTAVTPGEDETPIAGESGDYFAPRSVDLRSASPGLPLDQVCEPSPLTPSASPRPPPSPTTSKRNNLRRTTSVQTLRSTVTTTCHTASSPTDEPEPKRSNFPHQHLVSNLQHFAKYSSAAYGQNFLRILGIAKHDFKFPHTEIHANNHAFAHHVGIHVDDILLSSFTDRSPSFATDKMSPIVNYVAVDHSLKAVVLACRGSLGLSDILTDLTCSYEPIRVPAGDPSGSYFVHSGMYCSATVLQRGTVHDVVQDALQQFPDYGLVLCGHSLGGGVASLLSILWSTPAANFEREAADKTRSTGRRVVHPSISTSFVTSFSSDLPPGRPISCFTYGVPCVASLDLVKYCHGLVVSTVHNYDIVPTLSLGVLRDFKSMAMGFYAEQGVCEEIVGRVIGLCQRRFMAKRAARKAAATAAAAAGKTADFAATSSTSTLTASISSPIEDADGPDSLTGPAEESRLVPFTVDELTAGRGSNKALEPAYQDPSLLGTDLVADDIELSNWLWSLRTTIRASSDNEKLFPPGNVYVVENYTVFVSSESSSTGKYSRREGRRVLLRAVDDVERRFSEPVFSRSMLSDHSPANYELNCDYLASAVV
ncbi:lipase family protein [Rhodotorula paludigena]|uniref:lipase family protein n=1 Tax=Rhodotorula paludigena TaxID=86838 RepID=UPI0031737CA8